MNLLLPERIIDEDKNNSSNKTITPSSAREVFKTDLVGGLGGRFGDKFRISESAQVSWEELLLLYKLAERERGPDHPWTLAIEDVVYSVFRARQYRSMKSEDTEVETIELPPELLMDWRRRKETLRR